MKPEKELSRDIISVLTMAGFLIWSTEQGFRSERGGTRTSPGIPDLLACGNGYTILVELKVGKNKLTIHQEFFRQQWTENGGTSLVWRSVDDAWKWLVSEGIIVESAASGHQMQEGVK